MTHLSRRRFVASAVAGGAVLRTLRPEKVHEFEPMRLARAGAPSRAAH